MDGKELLNGAIIGLNSALAALYAGQNVRFCIEIGEVGKRLAALRDAMEGEDGTVH